MPRSDRVQFRRARAHDAGSVAALHVDSWRRNYRGVYADTFLDGEVLAERLAFGTARLGDQPANRFTIVAEEAGSLVGFASSILDEDPTWGALLDHLHIAHPHQRQGRGVQAPLRVAQSDHAADHGMRGKGALPPPHPKPDARLSGREQRGSRVRGGSRLAGGPAIRRTPPRRSCR
jgi:hypothetical protein